MSSMANNIYVGGFPYKTTKEELAKLFSACGKVLSAKIILDRDTGRPKGFGFVEMSTDDEAKVAVEKLNGSFIGDRKIFVVEGRPEKDRPQGYTPKPSFTPAPAPAKPGFIERRSGKDRRGAAVSPAERREAPAAPASAPFAKKPWVKKPFDAAGKKPWEKKPFDAAAKKPWEKKPFDAAAKKPWEKKPFDAAAKKPWAKKPFDPAARKPWANRPDAGDSSAPKKAWEKKPFDPAAKKPFDKKPWAKKPFDRKAPARGPKWTPPK
jgi:RNA recognition motif-containing protein